MNTEENVRVIERFFGMFREPLKAEWNGEGYEVGLFYIMPVKMPRQTIGGRKIEVDGWEVSVGIPPTGDVVELGSYLGIGLAAQAACKEHAAMLARIEMDRMADDAAARDWEESVAYGGL